MKKVSLLVVGLLCLSVVVHAGEVITNDTDENATGLRVVFSAPVLITGFGDILANVDQEGLSYEFIFSGGTVAPWGSHWFNYSPATASVVEYEWLTATPKSLADGWVRGIHMGGRWGTNWDLTGAIPADYFSFLERVNANWIGIQIMLTYDDSMDSSLRPFEQDIVHSHGSFSDEVLRGLIRSYREKGFHVYLTIALDDGTCPIHGNTVERWQLGDPFAFQISASIDEENWPWHPGHPIHETFVNQFFDSYTHWAVHYAKLAEEEAIELFSLGTETDRLFRVYPTTERWPTGFGSQMRAMCAAVREVYSGLLTYDKAHCCDLNLDPAWEREQTMDAIWGYLDLDVIGLSTYLPLFEEAPAGIPTVELLRDQWERVFSNDFLFFRNLYPTKPILLLEFGYVDHPGASVDPGAHSFERRYLIDTDSNGIDDGAEEQAAILKAFFLTASQHPSIINGVFMWGNMVCSDPEWTASFGRLRHYSIRDLPSELVVSEGFARFIGEGND